MAHLIASAIQHYNAIGVAYTERQLYYAACRVLVPTPVQHLLARLPAFTLPAPLRADAFQQRLNAWIARHGSPPGMCAPTEALPTHAASEPDLEQYALPRLLIIQSAAICAMLHANAATMEFGCPIISIADPTEATIPAAFHSGLARATEPTILLLHDASCIGISAAHALAATIPAHAHLRVIGLRPLHAQRLHLFAQRATVVHTSILSATSLTRRERRWLQRGWYVETAAIPPRTLLRGLRQSMHPAPAPLNFWQRLRDLRQSGFMTG